MVNTNDSASKTIDLKQLFLSLQKQMIAKLTTNRENILHPGTKGDASEIDWIKMLRDYLPKRYNIDKAFVLDSKGCLSDQIDIVIYDRQYSPFLFNQSNALYIPAESVYAVIEVKQDMDKANLEYAGIKAASVRALLRTSIPVPHVSGVAPAKKPHCILAGLVTLGSSWNPVFGEPFCNTLEGLAPNHKIDIGCVLEGGAFVANYPRNAPPHFKTTEKDCALISFFLHLLAWLQSIGTAPMMDVDEYAKALS